MAGVGRLTGVRQLRLLILWLPLFPLKLGRNIPAGEHYVTIKLNIITYIILRLMNFIAKSWGLGLHITKSFQRWC